MSPLLRQSQFQLVMAKTVDSADRTESISFGMLRWEGFTENECFKPEMKE